jgi:hypothetical protein
MNDHYITEQAFMSTEPEDYVKAQQDFYDWYVVKGAADLVASKGYQAFLVSLTEAIAARTPSPFKVSQGMKKGEINCTGSRVGVGKSVFNKEGF